MLLQCFEIPLFGVRDTITPAAEENPDPFEGQGTDGGVVALTLGALAVVERPAPSRKSEWSILPIREMSAG